MGKLLAIALVFAAGPALGEDRPTPPAAAPGATAASAPAAAAKKPAATKAAKKSAPGGKGVKTAQDAKAPGAGAKAEEKPCEPVKPCPID